MEADRFQIYKKALELHPDYAAAVRKAEAEISLPLYARLYLHTFAPAVTAFAGWVLDEAAKNGKKRLYFLSRDGYQPYLAAQALAVRRGLSIECRYLHVSRYAMRVPAYHLDMRSGLEQMCVGGIDVTPEKLLKRGALTDAECMETAVRLGLKDGYHDILQYHQIQRLKQILAGDDVFLGYVEKHSKESYADAMGYLAQEGLLSDIPYALVDSGWVGTLQQSMELLVQSQKPQLCLEGYYFGLYEIPAGAKRDAYHTYYFSPCRGLQRKACFSNSLFEAVCSADEGMTLGYVKRGGSFFPRQEKSGLNGAYMQWYQKALQLFLHQYEEKQKPDAAKMIERLFMALMSRPARIEVNGFGNLLFSADVREEGCGKLAAELTKKEIKNQYILRKLCIIAGLKKAMIRESAWMEGSIVKNGIRKGKEGSSWYIKRELFHIRLQKYLIYARKQIKSGKKRK